MKGFRVPLCARMRAIAALLPLLALCACGRAQQTTTRTLYAMDTVMELTLYAADADEEADALEALIRSTESTWSVSAAGSVPAVLNAGQEPEDAAREVVGQVLALSERCGGAFSPTLGALSELWGFSTGAYYVPTEAEIAAALQEEKWDFGGAIKGYTGQIAAEYLESTGIPCAIMSLGGNVQTYGEKADGTAWQIGIQNPEGDGCLGIVCVSGTASIVTSGSYQRYFEADGVLYHHIPDPATGSPARSGLRSVTVIARDGLTADVLSTALFVLGLEAGSELWRESDDFEAVFVAEDGSIWATEGAALSGCDYEVIARETD